MEDVVAGVADPGFLIGFLAATVNARNYRLSVIPANCPWVSHDSCLFHGISES
jgi:molybdopterin-guanine dinucleotide biosynthesis protein A